MDEVRGGTVDADLTGARTAGDDVRLETCTVGDVHDRDLLTFDESGRGKQVGVHRDGTDVVQVGLRDGGAMDLGPENGLEHA